MLARVRGRLEVKLSWKINEFPGEPGSGRDGRKGRVSISSLVSAGSFAYGILIYKVYLYIRRVRVATHTHAPIEGMSICNLQ